MVVHERSGQLREPPSGSPGASSGSQEPGSIGETGLSSNLSPAKVVRPAAVASDFVSVPVNPMVPAPRSEARTRGSGLGAGSGSGAS